MKLLRVLSAILILTAALPAPADTDGMKPGIWEFSISHIQTSKEGVAFAYPLEVTRPCLGGNALARGEGDIGRFIVASIFMGVVYQKTDEYQSNLKQMIDLGITPDDARKVYENLIPANCQVEVQRSSRSSSYDAVCTDAATGGGSHHYKFDFNSNVINGGGTSVGVKSKDKGTLKQTITGKRVGDCK